MTDYAEGDNVPNDEMPEMAGHKNQAAAELGRRGGRVGGAARAARMSPQERADAARLAAKARWARERAEIAAGARERGGKPFVFTLFPAEMTAITATAVAGRGGLQTLQQRLKEQLSNGNTVAFDNAGLGQLIRYMTRYPSGGGFQDRLHDAFDRSLKALLGYR